jgi:hypothetical protein
MPSTESGDVQGSVRPLVPRPEQALERALQTEPTGEVNRTGVRIVVWFVNRGR